MAINGTSMSLADKKLKGINIISSHYLPLLREMDISVILKAFD